MVTAMVGATEVELRPGFAMEQRGSALLELGLRDGRLGHLLGQTSLHRRAILGYAKHDHHDERAEQTPEPPDTASAPPARCDELLPPPLFALSPRFVRNRESRRVHPLAEVVAALVVVVVVEAAVPSSPRRRWSSWSPS